MKNKLNNHELDLQATVFEATGSPTFAAVFREALAYREAESEPVAIVETSDRMTFAQLVGTEPRRKSVRELYEGGLAIGQKLYTSPVLTQPVLDEREAFNQWNNDIDCPLAGLDTKTAAWRAWSHRAATSPVLGRTPAITERQMAVIQSLLKLAYAAWDACDDSEQVIENSDEYHKIPHRQFNSISNALDELEALPDDQPGIYMEAAAKARWALRDILTVSTSPVLGQTPALTDVIAERQRQITTEGWTPEHDDRHSDNELAGAAACYAMNMHDFYIHYTDEFNWSEAPKPDDWPWSEEWWKPTNPRRDLVKAAALMLAEIERLDRAAIAKATGESE